MNLLDVVNVNDEERIFKCNNTRTFYKMENDDLLFRNEAVKEWTRSTIKIRELRKLNVEEIQEGRKKTHGETYYFIDDEGNIVGDEEIFSMVDDNRYEIGNYFKNKEEAEECRDLIKETIREFKGRNKTKQECEEELEEEFEKVELIEIEKEYNEKVFLDKNYTCLEDFKNKKDCLYIDVNGRSIALSMEDWEKLNEYVERLRKFK